jgi:uncharacterized protein YbjT (DUF2867 family)
MELLIVGATGTLGRQVVRRALDEGHRVRCLVRNPKKAEASFLKEWGAELVKGDICNPESIIPALEGIEAVIDASTARATDSLNIKQVDWEGRLNLIKALQTAGVDRYIFFSILNAEQYREVPLMEIKYCTEKFLVESGLKYTVFRLCGFMQGLIPQYGIPILDDQSVWISGESSAIAYTNTQDIAKFAVAALNNPETEKQTYPVVGTRAWKAEEIVALCERISGKKAKVVRVPLAILGIMRGLMSWFKWTKNASDRLAFAEVLAKGKSLDAPMTEVYTTFGIDPNETTTLESYMSEYFSRITKKLKEIGYEKDKEKERQKRKKSSFFK